MGGRAYGCAVCGRKVKGQKICPLNKAGRKNAISFRWSGKR